MLLNSKLTKSNNDESTTLGKRMAVLGLLNLLLGQGVVGD
jgi:hypothetical protein